MAMRLWGVARWAGLVVTGFLLAGLVWSPELSLDVLWNILIPLVPASLLISPAIWRNVCPLATLNILSNRSSGNIFSDRSSGRRLGLTLLPGAELIGIALLLVLVPARRFLFNEDGLALAITVATVALLALVLGAVFQFKAGFCNAICPVLPVERLYGQHPLLQLSDSRCVPCQRCTMRGCLDLGPAQSIPAVVGRSWGSSRWLLSPYGAFAAAFPGFVVGYSTLNDGPLAMAGDVYMNVALWMAVSYLGVVLVTVVLRASAGLMINLLAAVAFGLYYWFAAEAITNAFDIAGIPTLMIRVTAGLLVLYWLARAVPRTPIRSLR